MILLKFIDNTLADPTVYSVQSFKNAHRVIQETQLVNLKYEVIYKEMLKFLIKI